MVAKKKVLFICTHNSARSQMAEGLVNALFSDRLIAKSAGTTATKVHESAIYAMKERGIDISHHRSKNIHEFRDESFDYVVTVCDSAKEGCPFFPGAKKYFHEDFLDPASAKGTKHEIMNAFRSVRDQIKEWIEKTLT